MPVPAIVAAGDLRASKAVYGESKAYLEVGDRPLVAHIVSVLQHVPEVSEVWVVGNAERLAGVFTEAEQHALAKPFHIVNQFRNLYENGVETYRRALPGAPPEGRDATPDEREFPVLFLSADLPFATPQEISQFLQRSLAQGCDYAMGLVTEESMEPFYPTEPGGHGIQMAYFNLREGRVRQSNLHLIRPEKIGNRHYIEEMYEHRYQQEWGNILSLAWTLLWSERGGPTVVLYYSLMHLASLADRRGWRRTADRIRSWIPMPRIEKGCSALLRCSFRFVVTEVGGCGVDVDNEHDLDMARARYDEWTAMQRERGERLVGPLPLPATTTPEPPGRA
jgi:GTP:adenosylcobinamide-phosphate guanylyltransferase